MKFVVGGQIERDAIRNALEGLVQGTDITIDVMGDIEASQAVKNGQADYYFGACNTGAGGALAMAIALIGFNKCGTVGMPGKIIPTEEMTKMISDGVVAFGFTGQDIDVVLPILVPAILKFKE
ncbi:DUF2620 domain-containing protein [Vibrio sp. DW001]|uniref:DUF2620 domain-containing protein n=1 Tax=Vibrio sp. DW001 TaxID=2912315 RepID=UPI0023B1EFFF|nr:DUF2620 domain-containing protein [Vibrio sp. DW001]WED26277.1 DUF2620 domain-containing protein [Vibrio sp. DW001]